MLWWDKLSIVEIGKWAQMKLISRLLSVPLFVKIQSPKLFKGVRHKSVTAGKRSTRGRWRYRRDTRRDKDILTTSGPSGSWLLSCHMLQKCTDRCFVHSCRRDGSFLREMKSPAYVGVMELLINDRVAIRTGGCGGSVKWAAVARSRRVCVTKMNISVKTVPGDFSL